MSKPTQIEYSVRNVVDAPVELNADKIAVMNKSISEIYGALRFVSDLIKSNSLTTERAYNAISVAENELERIGKQVNIETHKAAQEESRCRNMRALNEKIREMEADLAKACPNDIIPPKLAALKKGFCIKVAETGVCHERFGESTFEANYADYVSLNCQLRFGVHEFNTRYSDTPESDKISFEEEVKILEKEYDLSPHERGENDRWFLDTDKNKDAFLNKMRLVYPSFEVLEWTVKFLYNHRVVDTARARVSFADLVNQELTS